MTRFLPKTLKFYFGPTILALIIVMALITSFLPSTVLVVKAQDEPTVPNSTSATFPANAGTLGAIPDGVSGTCYATPGTPKDVTFTVSGLSGAPTSVSVTMNLNHTWLGDVRATLIAPNAASHLLFGRVNSIANSNCGSSNDFNSANALTFIDTATTNFATAAGTNPVVPTGNYRTVPSGPYTSVPPAPTTINTAFAGVANPNGTWILRLEDGTLDDTGDITAASLTITAGPTIPRKANVDFDNDGKSDWVVTRPTTPVTWYISINGSATTAGVQHGNPTDVPTPADYDGDGKADVAVWRSGAQGVFYILKSSTGTVDTVLFGQTGDDPKIVGDYDGDNKADVAVYRPGATQGFFFYKGTNNNPSGNITYIPWGAGLTVTADPGDYDGDGKYDFCLRRDAGGGVGQFALLKSSNLSVEWITWGSTTDTIVPGDFDADGMFDFMVVRTSGGVRNWYLLERDGGGTGASPFIWGLASDTIASGDYDGDGKQDIAIWRGTDGVFYVRRSSDGTLQTFQLGASGDYAAANWYVH